MNSVSIQILFLSESGSKILQRASFPQKNMKPEVVAYKWWQEIKREMFVKQLVKVICNGEEITEVIKEMVRKELLN